MMESLSSVRTQICDRQRHNSSKKTLPLAGCSTTTRTKCSFECMDRSTKQTIRKKPLHGMQCSRLPGDATCSDKLRRACSAHPVLASRLQVAVLVGVLPVQLWTAAAMCKSIFQPLIGTCLHLLSPAP